MQTLNQMARDLELWCKEKGYPLMSADELLVERKSDSDPDDYDTSCFVVDNDNDRDWLRKFINDWEGIENEQ